MHQQLTESFRKEKDRFLETCTVCGQCARKCPVVCRTDLAERKPADIQKHVKSFLAGGEPDSVVFTRAFSCMECFQCVTDHCPESLNPLQIHQIIKGIYRESGYHRMAYTDPADPAADQRILASIQIDGSDYRRIFKPTAPKPSRFVFFPGCNVYHQPDKLLAAMDLLDRITDDWALLPGLDHCCGNAHLYAGAVEKADQSADALIAALAAYAPEAVIFWCPTCHCHFETTLAPAKTWPFRLTSFPRFLARHRSRLAPMAPLSATLTLHEACKSAFTGLDPDGPRALLKAIPGARIVEMPRHGKATSCCGSGAADGFPASFAAVRDERLREAAETGADFLVDVCHFCHYIFCQTSDGRRPEPVNYATLIGAAMGIRREDRMKGYLKWQDLDRILADAEPFIRCSPFTREQIADAVRRVILCPPPAVDSQNNRKTKKGPG